MGKGTRLVYQPFHLFPVDSEDLHRRASVQNEPTIESLLYLVGANLVHLITISLNYFNLNIFDFFHFSPSFFLGFSRRQKKWGLLEKERHRWNWGSECTQVWVTLNLSLVLNVFVYNRWCCCLLTFLLSRNYRVYIRTSKG